MNKNFRNFSERYLDRKYSPSIMKTKNILRKNVHPSLILTIVCHGTIEIFAGFSTSAVKFLDFQFFTVHS